MQNVIYTYTNANYIIHMHKTVFWDHNNHVFEPNLELSLHFNLSFTSVKFHDVILHREYSLCCNFTSVWIEFSVCFLSRCCAHVLVRSWCPDSDCCWHLLHPLMWKVVNRSYIT